ncbi:DUF1203 domain-containing protein [Massilia arenosa]|uniref:DUF1203 domain-containing protein n=1 Tax=Zemynaea arenosa TaxID=2561931 RepID=A0A4Y9SKT4_9BURK|nr:DUF1203 domain-containing protein [Massilia arenosa]TFW22246.1 DUF1203 domain-containing protein [Massilia arenosa]
MPAYRIIPIDPDFVARARAGRDDQGQLVEHHIAAGGEPLRDQLRRACAGERIILASYCPFESTGPYREYGPVFVSSELPAPAVPAWLPWEGDTPYLGRQIVVRGYSDEERIVDAYVSSRDQADADIARLFAQPDIRFILMRFAAWGCYALRLERQEPPEPAGSGG